MIKLTEAYKECAHRYKSHFGYGVPLYMIPQSVDTNELIQILNECIELDNDELLKNLFSSDEESILY